MYVCMYVCMYITMYICMYVCMYVYMYVCMYVYMYVCMYVCVCMHVCMCMYVCMYVFTLHSFRYTYSGDHTETVEIKYDPKQTSYQEMLKLFWINHDPTRCASRQYMSAIFYHNEEQKRLAEESKEEAQKKLTKKIVTKITQAETFYNAEE